MKSDLTKYKFAQAPRYSDDQVDMCQKNAILRHIARRWNLYGDGGLSQAAQVSASLVSPCVLMTGGRVAALAERLLQPSSQPGCLAEPQ